MNASFTGSHAGMTPAQRRAVDLEFDFLGITRLIHGGCVGADDEVDRIAADRGVDRVVYPSDLKKSRVPEEVLRERGASHVWVHMPSRPLFRNRRIAAEGEVVIAAPRQVQEILRSGTWSTVRYARKMGKRVRIIFPDGTVVEESRCAG